MKKLHQNKGLADSEKQIELPQSLQFGEAIANGGCFYDSLAQSWNQIQGVTQYNEKQLRMICHCFYLKNKALVNGWNNEDKITPINQDEYYFVQYTAEELAKDFNNCPPLWGRPAIEGRILCRELNLPGILVIEICYDEDMKQSVPGYYKATKEDYKQISDEQEISEALADNTIPKIAVGQKKSHFVPILSVTPIIGKNDNFNQENSRTKLKQKCLKPKKTVKKISDPKKIDEEKTLCEQKTPLLDSLTQNYKPFSNQWLQHPQEQLDKKNIENLTEWLQEAKKNQWLDDVELEDEKLLAKVLTTLLYETKRHKWNEEPCLSFCFFIKLYCEWKKSNHDNNGANKILLTFVKNCADTLAFQDDEESQQAGLIKALSKYEQETSDYYGSYLSDDSDSDESRVVSWSGCYDSDCEKILKPLHPTYKKKQKNYAKGDIKLNCAEDLIFKIEKLDLHSNKNNKEQIQQDIKVINTHLAQGCSFEAAIRNVKTQFFIAQYRGIAYTTTRWGQPSRRNHRELDEVDQPLFSASIHKAAGAYPFCLFYKQDIKVQRAFLPRMAQKAEYLREKLVNARKSQPVAYNAQRNKGEKHYTYNNRAHLIQDLYTNDYQDFFTQIKKDNFKVLINDENPFISTGSIPRHALAYAYGNKYYENNKEERLRPRWRKDGRAERPYSGKVYVSLHPLTDYDEKGPLNVPKMRSNAQLTTVNNVIHERESCFPSYLAANRIITQHVARYPSFHRSYKKAYLHKYGLDENLYNGFKRIILKNPPHSKENKAAKFILGKWIALYHEFRLLKLATKAAEDRGAVLVYQCIDGSISLIPDTSNDIGTPSGKKNAQKRKTIKTQGVLRTLIAQSSSNGSKVEDLSRKEVEATVARMLDDIFGKKEIVNAEENLIDGFEELSLTGKKEEVLPSAPIILNGITEQGDTIQLERHETSGGARGLCGINALPVPTPEKLYSDILAVLADEKHPDHALILGYLGVDIAALIMSADIQLDGALMEESSKYREACFISSNNSKQLEELNKYCSQIKVCQSFINDDLKKNNWISIGVILCWAVLNKQNTRVWQIEKEQKATVRSKYVSDDPEQPFYEIAYINGNHYELLSRVDNGILEALARFPNFPAQHKIHLEKLLMRATFDERETLLLCAIKYFGNDDADWIIPFIEALINAGEDVNQCSGPDVAEGKAKEGDMPIFAAIRAGDILLVQLLIKYGAKVKDIFDDIGLPPIMVAGRDEPMIEVLVKAGADIDAFDSTRESNPFLQSIAPLVEDYVDYTEHLEFDRDFTEFLIKMGADIGAYNADGDDAMMLAVYDAEDKDAVELLFEHHIDIDDYDIHIANDIRRLLGEEIIEDEADDEIEDEEDDDSMSFASSASSSSTPDSSGSPRFFDRADKRFHHKLSRINPEDIESMALGDMYIEILQDEYDKENDNRCNDHNILSDHEDTSSEELKEDDDEDNTNTLSEYWRNKL